MQGHKVSEATLKVAQSHAQKAKEHGERIEGLAAALRKDKSLTENEVEFIQEAGQQIQEHAKAMLQYTRLAELDEEHSTEAFVAAGQQHAEAIKLHTEVNKIFLRSGSDSSQDTGE